jgi:hypothetical protein
MILNGTEIRSVHRSFGSVVELSERRRAIYRLTLEMVPHRADGHLPWDTTVPHDVLDNPLVRAHLGGVLGGTVEYDPGRVRSVREFAEVLDVGPFQESLVHLFARRDAAHALDPALMRIGAGLGQVDLGTAPSALVLSDSALFEPVRALLADGVRLALDVAPELAGDLLPHVTLLAVVREGAAGRLGSASLREFPGLIVMPEPQSALEVAEALVHEGAHVKFFDMAMTCSMLAAGVTERFRPGWAPPDAAAWPIEQTVAAFHAYCCLAAFHEALQARGEFTLHDHSLLPLAADRAGAIGQFLLSRGGHLGPDGQALVGRMTRQEFAAPAARTDATDLVRRALRAESSVLCSKCGEWTLLMQWTNPATIAWVPSSQMA